MKPENLPDTHFKACLIYQYVGGENTLCVKYLRI